MERVQGKKLPLTAAGVHGLRAEYIRTIEPARALAAETLKLERLPSAERGMRRAECPAEIELLWQTAPPRIPVRQYNMIPPSAEQPPLNPKGFRFAIRGCDVPRRRVLSPPSLLEGLRAFDGGSAVAAGHYSALHLRTP